MRELSVRIAVAVIKEAVRLGLSRREGIPWEEDGGGDEKQLVGWVRGLMWRPEYREMRKVDAGEGQRGAMGEIGVGSVRRMGKEV